MTKACAQGHRWKIGSFSQKEIHEYCARERCEERRVRPPTPDERKRLKRWLSDGGDMHKLNEAFSAATEDHVGWDMMEVARVWEEKHNGRISIAHVDDDYFSNSMLVFVTNEDEKAWLHPGDMFDPKAKAEKHWMGVSVVYIPQCTGENPIRFFLYPSDLDGLIQTLKALKRRQGTFVNIQRGERAHRRALAKARLTDETKNKGKKKR